MRFPVPPAYGDLSVAPLQASDFRHQPPAAVFSAECDPLASDGAEYAARLREAGVPVEFHEEPGMVHGYLRARHMARGAAESFARMVAALDRLAARAAAEAAAAHG